MTTNPKPRRPFVHGPNLPPSPAHRLVTSWPLANQNCYAQFRTWLFESGYGPSSLHIYGVAARMAFSLLDKSYWQIDPDADLATVRDYICAHYASLATRESYLKGIAKLGDFLRLRFRRPKPEPEVHWATFVGALSEPLATSLRAYLTYRCRNWPPAQQAEHSRNLLSHLTHPLRWLTAHGGLAQAADVTPARWHAYVDARLAASIGTRTVNGNFLCLSGWLRWLQEQDEPVCERMLKLKPLAEPEVLPRDVPPEQVKQLWRMIQAQCGVPHGGWRRCGLMDMAWFLLMLHSGLRTGEIRRLRLSDIDWERRTVRIEQSKGLKDRLIPLSAQAVEALKAYLVVRGPANALPAQLFIYRHSALSVSYCGGRLYFYGARCGVQVTPHQLRHTCATLLLNAGAPVVTVQTVLGHKWVNTTLGYARLYDGTLAADYYRAMTSIELTLALPEDAHAEPPRVGVLIALANALQGGTLNEAQRETLGALRVGLLRLADHEKTTA